MAERQNHHENEIDKEERLEKFKIEMHHEKEIRRIEHQVAANFASSAIRFVIISNGGSCIAILALLGNSISVDMSIFSSFIGVVKIPFFIFASGVSIGVLCAGLAYLVQMFYYDGNNKTGDRLRNFTICVGALGTLCFLLGVVIVFVGFTNLSI